MGTAKYTSVKTAAQIKTTLSIKTNQPNAAATVSLTAVHKLDGTPISETSTTTVQYGDRKLMETRAVTFQGRTATLKTTRDGKTETVSVAAPAGAELRDKTVTWFISSKPKIGETSSRHSFSMESKKWAQATGKYHGLKEVQVGNRKQKLHYITEEGARGKVEVYVDDKGVPQMIVAGGLVIRTG